MEQVALVLALRLQYKDYGGDGKETNITGTPQMMAAGGGGFMSPLAGPVSVVQGFT